jgi:hypothetical protein
MVWPVFVFHTLAVTQECLLEGGEILIEGICS